MANRYWVGGSANWDTTAGSKWATTSGGAGGSAVPTSADDVFLDGNSGAVTITTSGGGGRNCKSLTCTGFTGTLAGSSRITVSGNVVLAAGMTITMTGNLEVNAAGSITSNGKSLTQNQLNFIMGAGNTYTINDALVSTQDIILTSGTLNANNQNITCSRFASSATGSVRVLNMGSGTWTLTSAAVSQNVWDIAATNLTINANTSTIKINGGGTAYKAFVGGGFVYNNIWLSGSGTGSFRIIDDNIFNDFKCDAPPHTIRFDDGSTTTMATFTVSGTAGNLITIDSISTTGHNLVKSSGGMINRDYLSISHSSVSPSSTWFAGSHSTDGGNNAGWSFGVGFAGDIVEAGSAADAITVTLPVTISETLAAADVQAQTAIWTNAISESGAASEVITGLQALPSALTETGSATDTVTGVRVTGAAIAETGSAVDSTNASLVMWVNETLVATSTQAATSSTNVAVTETLASSDSLVVTLAYAVSLIETGAIADDLAATTISRLTEILAAGETIGTGGSIWIGALTNSLPVTDAFTLTRQGEVDIVETRSLVDVLTSSLVARPRLAETLNAVELIVGIRSTAGRLINDLVAADQVNATRLRVAALAEAGSVTDLVGGVRISGHALVESRSLVDQVVGLRHTPAALVESRSIVDVISPVMIRSGVLAEYVQVVDQLTGVARFAPSLVEALSVVSQVTSRIPTGEGRVSMSDAPKASVTTSTKVIE